MAIIDLFLNVRGVEQGLSKTNRFRQSMIESKLAIKQLDNEIDRYNYKLEKLNITKSKLIANNKKDTKAWRDNKRAIKETGDAITRTTKKVNALSAKQGKLTKSVGKSSKAMKINQSIMRSGITLLTRYLGAFAALSVIKNTINIIKDFELGLRKVSSILNATTAEIEILRESAISLSGEGIFSPTEITALQFQLAKLGFTIDEITSSTSGIIDLATATGESIESSTTLVASTIRGFGLYAEETGSIVNVMGKAFVTSALDVSKLREEIKYIAPIARRLGWTFEETIAISAKLADSIISGSLAGTSLRNVFLELSNSSSNLTQALGSGNLTFDRFIARMQDFSSESLDTLKNMIGIKRAATAFAVIAQDAKDIKLYADGLRVVGDVMAEIKEAQMDTVAYQLKRVGNEWQSLILSIKSNGGWLLNFLEKMGDILDTLGGGKGFLKVDVRTDMIASYRRKWKGVYDEVYNLFILEGRVSEGYIKSQEKINEEREKLNTLINDAIILVGKLSNEAKEQIGDERQATIRKIEAHKARISLFEKEIAIHSYFHNILINNINQETGEIIKFHDLEEKIEAERIKRTEYGFKEMRKLENNHYKWRVAKINDTIEDEKEANLKLEYERLKHINILNDINMKEVQHYRLINKEISDYKIRAMHELFVEMKKGELRYKKRMEETKKTLEEAKSDMLESFELNREDYVDDIPFNTEEIVDGLIPKDWEDIVGNFIDGVDLIIDSVSSLADAQVYAIDRIVDRYDTMVNEVQNALNTELILMEQGYANNVDAKRAELEQIKALREKALGDQQKYVKQQQLLESIVQGINLASAASSIIKSAFANAGIWGALITPAILGAMFTLWNNAKIKSINASYPTMGEGGWIDGNPHSRGGININAEGGEYMVNKDSARANAPLLEAINNSSVPLSVIVDHKLKDDLDAQMHNLSMAEAMVSLDDSDTYREMKDMNKQMRSILSGKMISYSNGYRIEITGSKTRRIRDN